MLMNTRKYFVRIPIQSFSDIITNSSSELFVFQKPSVKDVIKLLDDYTPGWRDEYEEPILFKDMDEYDQNNYIDWVSGLPYYFNYESDDEYNKAIIRTIHRDLCISEEEIPELFENWNKPTVYPNYRYYCLNLSSKGYNLYREKFKYDICLWSLDDNPDWDRQEKIMDFVGGKRYHLG